jgi:hypothetical protein
MDAPRKYLEELRSEFAFYPMWMPADRVELGSFGTFVDGAFRRGGRLADLGVDFVPKAHATKSSFKKQRGMTFRAGSSSAGQAGVIDASIAVTVSADSAYAWAFGAAGARKAEIEDILQVQTAVLGARRTGLWKDEWLLVSEIYEVDTLNVLIAKSRNVQGVIKAKAKIPSPEDVLVAEDVSYGFDASDFFVVENAKHTTPLFGLRKVSGFFGKSVGPISGGERATREPALERTLDESMFSGG